MHVCVVGVEAEERNETGLKPFADFYTDRWVKTDISGHVQHRNRINSVTCQDQGCILCTDAETLLNCPF